METKRYEKSLWHVWVWLFKKKDFLFWSKSKIRLLYYVIPTERAAFYVERKIYNVAITEKKIFVFHRTSSFENIAAYFYVKVFIIIGFLK
jgi:hypothetical protein